jgi:hypothetical protein
MPERRGLMRHVIRWCVEEHFGRLGGNALRGSDFTTDSESS